MTSPKVHNPIWLLLPAKDEEANLRSLLPQAKALGYEIVVCDDGSVDGTAKVAKEAGALVIRHPRNQGLGAALATLFDYFLERAPSNSWAVVMDADGTMPLETGLEMVATGDITHADIVIGSRYRGSAKGVPFSRWFLSLGARWTFSLLAPIPGITDYTIGFRAYRWPFLWAYRMQYPGYFDARGFSAQTELLLRARSMRPKVVEVGIHLNYGAKRGRSKMRVTQTAREYLRLALMARKWI